MVMVIMDSYDLKKQLNVTLLPADTYTVVNRCIITEDDKNNLISLYEPIIGPLAISLYFTFLRDLHRLDYISVDYTHHHLMAMMKLELDVIKKARETLEGVGLLKSYYKEGETNSYVYEVFSPLSPKEFFSSPIFNIALYDNLGKYEYNLIQAEYQLPKIDLKEYQEVSKELNLIYKSSSEFEPIMTKEHNSLNIRLQSSIDFDLIISSMPKGLVSKNVFTKKLRELIEQLAFIYDFDTLKMVELLRMVITEKGTFDKENLRKSARKYYQFNNNGRLPTLVYRTQPEYLKSPSGGTSPLDKIIYMFENTSPYDFLRIKYKGAMPASRDLKIIENLMIDMKLPPAVVNVLIDYVLKKNDNKMNQAFIETIAGQWKRSGIETAREAMELAKKENNKYSKVNTLKSKQVRKEVEPVWFNQEIKREEITDDEKKELDELLKDFR